MFKVPGGPCDRPIRRGMMLFSTSDIAGLVVFYGRPRDSGKESPVFMNKTGYGLNFFLMCVTFDFKGIVFIENVYFVPT